ncbi:hypothetical protein TBR22_A30970 [Luteitalea sp. TBR-22]|uniref:hypothetical protein n=1 Tax=Luteitalea sp. TBR-22 TaxID=2802971 RepID=UPI001AF7E57E|nr:hypothetical protein [Luteitalea sp. TBR-22]BCS33869.1 hypothetical protein TBR22_A30970 [Luteitalea sp. TBR-22]
MSFLPRIVAPRALPAVAMLLVAGACAPAPSATTTMPPPTTAAASSPVLLSCPTGQQPLLRQVVVGNTLVPQVECVTAPGPAVQAALAPAPGAAAPPAYAPMVVPAAAPMAVAPAPVAWSSDPRPAPVRTVVRRPAARRVVYDDVEEIQRPSRRSWQKSALIIGSAAGVGAGVGAATGGKKGALIGAAVGGGAATLWDQVTRRQPR